MDSEEGPELPKLTPGPTFVVKYGEPILLRIGHDARDRWSMIPALATPRQIVTSITNYLS